MQSLFDSSLYTFILFAVTCYWFRKVFWSYFYCHVPIIQFGRFVFYCNSGTAFLLIACMLLFNGIHCNIMRFLQILFQITFAAKYSFIRDSYIMEAIYCNENTI